jgi:signal transduction histidine kinase
VWYLLVTFAGWLLFGFLSYGALRFALFQGKKSHLWGREQRLIQFLEENKADRTPMSLSEQLRNFAIVTHEGNLFEIRNPEGQLIFPLDVNSADLITPIEADCTQAAFFFQSLEHQPAMVRCHLTSLNGSSMQLYIGGSLSEELYILRVYRSTLLLLMPGLLGLSALSGYLLSRHALKPVDRMTKAAVNIGIGNLSARLPVPPAKDEIQHLAIAWNQLLVRLETAVLRLSKFSEDVSHDLRTSITVMLATAQLSLHQRHAEEQYREDLNRIVMECRTASTLLDALLSLSRSNTFSHEVELERINICELVVQGCRRVEGLADSGGIMLDWNLPEEPLYIYGNELLLQRLLGILLDNAIKFTPVHGEIEATVSRRANEIVVAIRDTGIGMNEDVQQRIFERYYQADFRERETQAGNGLGLAIARWITAAHQAELSVESIPLNGSTFQIRFPLAIEVPPRVPLEQLV